LQRKRKENHHESNREETLHRNLLCPDESAPLLQYDFQEPFRTSRFKRIFRVEKSSIELKGNVEKRKPLNQKKKKPVRANIMAYVSYEKTTLDTGLMMADL
jgi:hypothetical protein